ncbi:hypothetical protein ADEAN_000291200 [Angomonas deanei]|uniref:Uncharacterized protein n=1 Tax=Angomonas deanei TaxID=59799 RepID=A0A7G2C9B5_9TRYP|nr:hypothetical protein ADEAN_000291200 [Angomonas deanei]
MFETVFEVVYFNPALSSLERYIAMGTAVMPVFALALFTYVNLRMTANEHSKFWKYVNTERRILYTFFSGSSAERGMSARERAEVEQLLQSERAPRSALW